MTNSPGAFPAYYDNCLLFADWNRSWFKFIRLDAKENKVAVEDFKLNFKFRKPIDIFFNKGVLYVLEYGTGWYNVKNGRLLRISYSEKFNQKADASADPRIVGMDANMAGTKAMAKTTCLSCHHAQDKVIGPSFVEIAEKYKGDAKAPALLVEKVKKGGVGVWGQQPMPAHGMHSDAEIKTMIDAVMKTKKIGGHKK